MKKLLSTGQITLALIGVPFLLALVGIILASGIFRPLEVNDENSNKL